MNASEQSTEGWERRFWTPGGDPALLFYVVFGELPQQVELRMREYRVREAPAWLDARSFSRMADSAYMEGFYTGPHMSRWLEALPPEDAAAVREASGCVVLRGEVPDPSDLLYLRDALGVITALGDSGGVAVLDPQTFNWWPAAQWKDEVWAPDDPQPHLHAVILASEDEAAPGRLWVHTRGLRKFGRPDISVRAVPPELQEGAVELCNRFIRLQVRGYRISEGQPIRMASLPEGLVCRHAGSYDDPDFNNVHVEVRLPAG